jgi:hypothetical protein
MTPGERRPDRSRGVAGVARAVGLWSALALLAQPGWCAEARRPNLQGAWKLNPDLTARLAKDQQEREQAEGGAGDARGRHPSGVPGVGGPQDDMGLGVDPAAAAKGRDRDPAQSQAGLLASLDVLTIAQQAGQVTITDLHGHSRILKTDGSKIRDAAAPGGPVQMRASWDKDDGLLVEVKADNGAKHTESYIVSNDGKHLYLTLTTDRYNQILRAYDLAPAAPAADRQPPAQAPAHQATQTPSPPAGATPPDGPPPS